MIIGFNTVAHADTPAFSQKFGEVDGTGSIVNAHSPARDSYGNDSIVSVISKTIEPRNVGTSPHIGTDLAMYAGNAVYAIFPGVVSNINNDTSAQLGSVTINLDINGDGSADGYYIQYMHVVPLSSLYVGKPVQYTTQIATIDSQKPNGFPPHLHFARVSSAWGITYKLYNFYTHIAGWGNGADMDFLSNNYIYNDALYITGYTKDETEKYALSGIDVFYRINGGSWSSTPAQMTLYNSSSNEWRFDFKSIASAGQTVDYYIAGHRANMSGDNWGLYEDV